MSTDINHVSVNARNLQESVEFYVDLLGAEPIPTPNFGLPVRWPSGALSCICSSATCSPPATTTSASPLTTWSRRTAPPSAAMRSTATRSTASGPAAGRRRADMSATPPATSWRSHQAGADRLPEDLRAQLKPLWDLIATTEAWRAPSVPGAGHSVRPRPSDPPAQPGAHRGAGTFRRWRVRSSWVSWATPARARPPSRAG